MKKDALSLLFLMSGVSLDRLTEEEQKRLRKGLNLYLLSAQGGRGRPAEPKPER